MEGAVMGRRGILLLVLIRSFDPELGVYRDAEVRDEEGVIEE